MKKLALVAVLALAGCTSQASQIADCQAQGISRDACYMAEKDRQNSINAAAEKQALENAAQVAQSAHKKGSGVIVKHFNGFEVKKDKLGIVSYNGSPAAVIETAEKATVYQSGITKITWYKNGKVAIMENDVFAGWAK
ncbi:hypothetical protein DRT11_23955 [Salmonella enterica subsp. enterica]|nr:hypothetical protein [Salmonella enterica subsp. enterica serovar Bareilly]